MAIIKSKDVRGMKPEERMKRLGEFRLELSKLKGSSAVGASIKEPGKVKELRKAIARILTVNKEEKTNFSQTFRKFDQTTFSKKLDQKRMAENKKIEGGKEK